MVKKEKNRAVALSYDSDTDSAPKISASGEGFIAEQIIKTAQRYDVPFYRDADLCEILVQMDVNAQIPEELYEVIARVLAFVYRANKNRGLLGPDVKKNKNG